MKINILGKTWTIHKDKVAADHGQFWGFTDLKKQEIIIDPDAHNDLARETLMHELMHVAYWNAGLAKTPKLDDVAVEELLIAAISRQLYGYMKENDLLNLKGFDKLLK